MIIFFLPVLIGFAQFVIWFIICYSFFIGFQTVFYTRILLVITGFLLVLMCLLLVSNMFGLFQTGFYSFLQLRICFYWFVRVFHQCLLFFIGFGSALYRFSIGYCMVLFVYYVIFDFYCFCIGFNQFATIGSYKRCNCFLDRFYWFCLFLLSVLYICWYRFVLKFLFVFSCFMCCHIGRFSQFCWFLISSYVVCFFLLVSFCWFLCVCNCFYLFRIFVFGWF